MYPSAGIFVLLHRKAVELKYELDVLKVGHQHGHQDPSAQPRHDDNVLVRRALPRCCHKRLIEAFSTLGGEGSFLSEITDLR